jgi:threonine dehydrogenase-like Zn-dependent dehydrogenase
MMDLLKAGAVDLKPLATHRLPLNDAENGFRIASQKECVKALLIP